MNHPGPTLPGYSYKGRDGLTYVDAERELKAWTQAHPAAARAAARRKRDPR